MNLTDKKLYPWALVVSYSLLGIFFPAAVTQFSMVVDDLASAFAVDRSVILLTDTLRAICLVSAMFLSSYIYRRLGLRRTMALGICLQILPQFLIPVAMSIRSLPMLFFFKGMQGLNAMAFPLYIASITMWIDSRYSALATAIFNGSFTAGSGVGAFLAGRLIPAFGVKSSFLVIGGIAAVFAVPALLLTREKERPAPAGAKETGVYKNVLRLRATWLLILALAANTWVTQAVTVDMPVFAAFVGMDYGRRGLLMLLVSLITVGASVLGGGISDRIAARAANRVRSRCAVMGVGYALSAVTAFLVTTFAAGGFSPLTWVVCAMMFGASWAGGVFWALPVEVYSPEDHVPGTAFCSGASNIPNPIAPAVVGVALGSRGLWGAGWASCGIVSAISMLSCLLLMRESCRQ